MPTNEPARPRKTTTDRKTTTARTTTTARKTATAREVTTRRSKARGAAPAALEHPGDDRIRERAYQFFIERGGAPGDPVADWLRAESELIAERTVAS